MIARVKTCAHSWLQVELYDSVVVATGSTAQVLELEAKLAAEQRERQRVEQERVRSAQENQRICQERAKAEQEAERARCYTCQHHANIMTVSCAVSGCSSLCLQAVCLESMIVRPTSFAHARLLCLFIPAQA